MGAPTGPLGIDRQLAAAATGLGVPVSDWQVKRWREGGLLPTRRPGLGRGRGSAPASFLPGAAEHAACLARALSQRRSLDEACLGCFWRGFSPRERTLKRAYSKQFNALAAWVERAGGSGDGWDVAERIARKLARRSGTNPRMQAARTRLRGAGKGAQLGDTITNLLALMLGRSGQINRDTLLAFGAQDLTTPLLGDQPLAQPDDLRLDWLTLPALTDTTKASPLSELEQARDTLTFLLAYLKDLVSLLKRARGIDLTPLLALLPDEAGCALLVPATLLVRARLGPETFDGNVEQLRQQHPRLQAINRLLDELPPDLNRLVGQAAISVAVLSDHERERMVTEVQAYIARHPEDLPLLLEESDQ